MEAMCAEPAIRAFKAAVLEAAEVTVSCRPCDLFRDHPGIAQFTLLDPAARTEFHSCRRLTGAAEAMRSGLHPVRHFAQQMQVELQDTRPWIGLDSFDLVRTQRFNIEALPHPRIAVAAGAAVQSDLWPLQKWIQLAQVLQTRLHGAVIQLGTAEEPVIDDGLSLLGRLSARETAAVLSRCDLLITTNNGCIDLAAAVQTPAIVLIAGVEPAARIHAGQTACSSAAIRNIEDISVDTVVEAIASLSRQALPDSSTRPIHGDAA